MLTCTIWFWLQFSTVCRLESFFKPTASVSVPMKRKVLTQCISVCFESVLVLVFFHFPCFVIFFMKVGLKKWECNYMYEVLFSIALHLLWYNFPLFNYYVYEISRFLWEMPSRLDVPKKKKSSNTFYESVLQFCFEFWTNHTIKLYKPSITEFSLNRIFWYHRSFSSSSVCHQQFFLLFLIFIIVLSQATSTTIYCLFLHFLFVFYVPIVAIWCWCWHIYLLFNQIYIHANKICESRNAEHYWPDWFVLLRTLGTGKPMHAWWFQAKIIV